MGDDGDRGTVPRDPGLRRDLAFSRQGRLLENVEEALERQDPDRARFRPGERPQAEGGRPARPQHRRSRAGLARVPSGPCRRVSPVPGAGRGGRRQSVAAHKRGPGQRPREALDQDDIHADSDDHAHHDIGRPRRLPAGAGVIHRGFRSGGPAGLGVAMEVSPSLLRRRSSSFDAHSESSS